MNRLFSKICLSGAALATAFSLSTAVSAETLTIAHSTWVGYGPLYIAQEEGFFEEEGLRLLTKSSPLAGTFDSMWHA